MARTIHLFIGFPLQDNELKFVYEYFFWVVACLAMILTNKGISTYVNTISIHLIVQTLFSTVYYILIYY